MRNTNFIFFHCRIDPYLFKDITVFLAELGLPGSPSLAEPIKVGYHDACHLAHAQGIRDAPRILLKSIQGVSPIEIPESDLCCGSAGTYNLEQPEIADQLGQRKVENILKTGADIVVMGNIGCMIQIRKVLSAGPASIRVLHTIELLDKAYAT
jgi:glycolate oxidase iron-sulfur subunit